MIWFRRKTRSDGLGIFFCSDVHGSTTCFKKFVNAATYYRQRGQPVHCLILGGDLTGKLIVPVIREDSHYRSYLLGREVELATAVELREFVKQCEMLGVYPNVFSVEEYEAFRSDSSLQEAVFRRLMLQRLEEWLAFAADRLHGDRQWHRSSHRRGIAGPGGPAGQAPPDPYTWGLHEYADPQPPARMRLTPTQRSCTPHRGR